MLHILTLSWQGKDKLSKLYPTLLNNLKNQDYVWHIKDNGADQETFELVNQWKNDKVNLIRYPHNKDNFAEGCNFLFKQANPNSNDIVLLLNNDVIFNDNKSIKNMLSFFKDKDIGAVGAKLKYTNSNIIQHAGVVFAHNGFPIHYRAHEEDSSQASLAREFQACTGALLAIRAENFQMDNKLVWAFDDIDACLNIKYNQNKKIIYCGETDVFHEESASLKKNPVNKLYLPQNLTYFSGKWKGKIKIDCDIYRHNNQFGIYEK